MKRRFNRSFSGLASLALLGAAGWPVVAAAALTQVKMLENDIAYLRVEATDEQLPGELSAAERALAVTNQPIGTILDLRGAGGDAAGAAKPAADFLAAQRRPLAVLVDGATRGGADRLAAELRADQTGLFLGSATEDVSPDITVRVKAADEAVFLKNPYAMPATNDPDGFESTSNFTPYIDHTSEADLVREKIKDGDEDETTAPARAAPARPVIRDPVLARAVDFLKARAVLRPARG